MENTQINPIEELIDKNDEQRIFKELSSIDGIHEYLRALLARDMRLHFSSKKDDQDLVRGAYFRTEWFLNKIKKFDK